MTSNFRVDVKTGILFNILDFFGYKITNPIKMTEGMGVQNPIF